MAVTITGKDFYKWLHIVLLIAILGLLLWSKPWDTNGSGDTVRTIRVSGEATIDAVPDEFVFYPRFEQTGTDQEALKTRLTKQANDAVEAIQNLGVPEDKISLDASSYDRWYWEDDEEGVLSAQITATVNDRELAQEVQDYLLTTSAKGQLTPQPTFSKDKQKQLESEAVAEASKDARSKAEAQAALFDAQLGDVVTVDQGRGFDEAYPYLNDGAELSFAEDSVSSTLPVLPGEDEYTQNVNVTYELR